MHLDLPMARPTTWRRVNYSTGSAHAPASLHGTCSKTLTGGASKPGRGVARRIYECCAVPMGTHTRPLAESAGGLQVVRATVFAGAQARNGELKRVHGEAKVVFRKKTYTTDPFRTAEVGASRFRSRNRGPGA